MRAMLRSRMKQVVVAGWVMASLLMTTVGLWLTVFTSSSGS